jgi:hypothetical protein
MSAMSESASDVCAFVDYAALAYHEARNVRHLKKDGHIGLGKYERLIDLPKNREHAWGALQDSRIAAKKARSATAVEAVFQQRFGLGLEDLEALFENRHWRHSASGGNRWAGITRALIDLRDAIDCQNTRIVSELVATIPQMPHNTGDVRSKLCRLDRCLLTTSS